MKIAAYPYPHPRLSTVLDPDTDYELIELRQAETKLFEEESDVPVDRLAPPARLGASVHFHAGEINARIEERFQALCDKGIY